MRRGIAVLTTLLALLLLAGCGKEEAQTQQAIDFRTELLSAGGCAFDADVRVDYGQTIAEFSMHCAASTADGVDMTVTAPETLAGIGAHVDGSGAKIVYDGAEIGFSATAGGKLAPMALPWLLTDCWSEGYIAYSGMEDGALRGTYLRGYCAQELQADVWFTDGTPVRAEICCDGQRVVTAELSNFTFEA